MNIMFNASSMKKGGAERVISSLANNFIKNNEVEILVNTKKGISYNLNSKIKIIELDKKRENVIIRNIKRLIKTKRVVEKEKPDIIISFLPMPSYRVLLLRKINKVPIIVCDRNDPKEEYKGIIDNILMKLLYKKADAFVFQTSQQRDYFSKSIRKKSRVIYNPIKDEFLNINNIEKDNIIINVGRLTEQKNQKILINAFYKISNEYKDHKLEIYGEGKLREKLQKQIDDLGLNDRVKLCGISDNIKNELEKAKIFVLSSNYEGMPNALIEAMAVGLPVISTDCPCGGPKELIQNGVNGFLISKGNEIELENKLRELLDDMKKAEKIGKEAKKIGEKLKFDNIYKQWNDYINDVLGGEKSE